MKNILNKAIVACIAVMTFASCTKQDDPFYEGEALLQFGKTDRGSATVEVGAVSSEAIIEYGTTGPVSGTHQVKLVYDAAGSTAVPGVDFTLVNGGVDEITAGEVTGQFKVKILESGATTTPKIANFHLESATLSKAAFGQMFALSMSKKCNETILVGNGIFNYTGAWQNPGQYQILKDVNGPKTLTIVDFLDTGVPLILKYDGNGIITFDQQDTGQAYTNGSNFIIKMSETGLVSRYDACARTLSLKVVYRAGTAYFGENDENFTGT